MPIERRKVTVGMVYTIDEEDADLIELVTPDPTPDPPPEELRGEPWGWIKEGPKPRGYPGPIHYQEEPGPFDGRWDRLNGDDDGS